MKRILLLTFFILASSLLFSQQAKIDSLKNVLNKSDNNTARIELRFSKFSYARIAKKPKLSVTSRTGYLESSSPFIAQNIQSKNFSKQ